MGLWANLPLAIGCAISLTAFTAFSLVLGQHISVPVALGAVFLMGVLFTVISATGIRSWILRNLPRSVWRTARGLVSVCSCCSLPLMVSVW